ncbi:hypothetical protein XACW160_300107 [Xanthomonas citri pv. citri]|nr:hypothetical protein XAC3824_260075 [Xanthomonas citri pv. citri]CEE21945.1 hypothetical protein XAC9322_260063 [Xanthomonas citri pv. citri]CEE23642.1 hypothetical protein XAC1083_260041 [Xanthomonas citri pv. citri]CEE38416.1 hypothetical protein XAC908_400041 [Xanthomonas citri pv. citri]CEE56568.1 hypothetical protein XAC71A_300076 [Xanthomonas citri pv. citri]
MMRQAHPHPPFGHLLPLAGEGQRGAWIAARTRRAQSTCLLPLAGEGGAKRRMRAALHRAPGPGREHRLTTTDRAVGVAFQQSLA